MAVGAFKGADQSLDAQKRALLSAVAQRGQAGAAALETQQKAAQAQRAEAVRGVAKDIGISVPPAALAGQLAGIAGGPGRVYAQEAGRQQAAFSGGIAQIGAANGAYMDQVAAARPVVESVTERQVAQIRAEQQEKERQRAFQREQDRLTAEQDALARAHERAGWAHDEKGWANDDTAGADGEAAPPRAMNEVSYMTGIRPEDISVIQTNQSYQYLGGLVEQMIDGKVSKDAAYASLARAARDLSKNTGVGNDYQTTVRLLWAQFGHLFPGTGGPASLAPPARENPRGG